MEDLTVFNFVAKIKAMDTRERNKLTAKKLIELICQVPESTEDSSPLDAQFAEMKLCVENLTKSTANNNNEIKLIRAENEAYVKQNAALRIEVDLLKVHAQECLNRERNRDRNQPTPPPAPCPDTTNAIDELRKEISALQEELNSIQQYLRINNLEIVGLPQPNENEDDETLIINALNNLDGIDALIRHEDIDISHPLNSNRKDGKSVHVVRFISRKTKGMVLTAKKLDANKQFQFRNCDVFVNEHLSKQNRALFAAAQERKRALGYKYCWTRGGSVNMRKTDNSPIVTITNNDMLTSLT